MERGQVATSPVPGVDPGPWPARLALGTFLSALPLVLFGGSVTTLGAGMAVEGWLVAEGHFMVLFPVEEWFRDTATFVEHTHRLFGVLVGLFAVATVVATFLRDRRASVRAFSLAGLLAVCGQGTLGGFRVLENSPHLAFLHGALAQAVFALLFAGWLVQRRSWRASAPEPGATRPSVGLVGLSALTAVAVYGQVFLGAWYRHQLRPSPQEGAGQALVLHLAAAFAVTGLVVVLALALSQRAEPRLRRLARGLFAVLGLQVLLGLVAWLGYQPAGVGPLEWIVSVGHVLGGGLLLSGTVAAALWTLRLRRLVGSDPAAAPAAPRTRARELGSPALGDAR